MGTCFYAHAYMRAATGDILILRLLILKITYVRHPGPLVMLRINNHDVWKYDTT